MIPQVAIKKLLSQGVGTEGISKTQQNIGFHGFCPFVLLSLGPFRKESLSRTTPTTKGHKDIRYLKGQKSLFLLGFIENFCPGQKSDRRSKGLFLPSTE